MGRFEIKLNGMVYVFDDDQLLEVMDMLDSIAVDAWSE